MDKKRIFNDLRCRVGTRTMVSVNGTPRQLWGVEPGGITCEPGGPFYGFDNNTIMPYLRWVPDMTQKECEEYSEIMGSNEWTKELEFYVNHHIDFNGLLATGDALEEAEMYND